jgi:hypothetical protein
MAHETHTGSFPYCFSKLGRRRHAVAGVINVTAANSLRQSVGQ